MALTNNQKTSNLFKKSQGVAETNTSRQFFEESNLSRQKIYSDQIWSESNSIPSTAPNLSADGISGVVQFKSDVTLNQVTGTTNSFSHPDLKDAIPFNFGDGSYNYSIKDSLNNPIAFGQGDWIVDTDSGVLTFYGSVPPNMPPKVSFYKYIGNKGVPTSSNTSSINLPNVIDFNSDDIITNTLTSGGGTPGDEAILEFELNTSITEGRVLLYAENVYGYVPSDYINEINPDLGYEIDSIPSVFEDNSIMNGLPSGKLAITQELGGEPLNPGYVPFYVTSNMADATKLYSHSNEVGYNAPSSYLSQIYANYGEIGEISGLSEIGSTGYFRPMFFDKEHNLIGRYGIKTIFFNGTKLKIIFVLINNSSTGVGINTLVTQNAFQGKIIY